ncbi:MAG: transglutaminase-like cysteine peptidase [Albidovulum sp.]|uniref:transglutaminase-like cysteine peptidase n=1 Tax=Albidovulum sp. TaxID=1872424 RepID=UPI003C951B61
MIRLPMIYSAFHRPRRIAARLAKLSLVVALGFAAPGAPEAAQPQSTSHIVARKAITAPQGATALCRDHAWACRTTGGGSLPDRSVLKVAGQVNSMVNRRVRSVSDRQQYGLEEVWALPTRRGGDCEDFALLKKKELIAAGMRPQDLLIATVLDRNRGSHAVLVLRTSSGDYVLDNLRNRIMPWRETGYSFIRMQNPQRPNRWVAVLAGGVFGA